MMALSNETACAVRFRVVQAALAGAVVVPPRGALRLSPAERYALHVTSRGLGYRRSLDLRGAAAHVVALRRSGEGSPPFDLEIEGATVPFALSCENTTPARIAFRLERPLGEGGLSLAAIVTLDQWQHATIDAADEFQVTAIVDGYPTEPLRLPRLAGEVTVAIGPDSQRPELYCA